MREVGNTVSREEGYRKAKKRSRQQIKSSESARGVVAGGGSDNGDQVSRAKREPQRGDKKKHLKHRPKSAVNPMYL